MKPKPKWIFVLIIVAVVCACIGIGSAFLVVLTGSSTLSIIQQSMAPSYKSGDTVQVDKLFFRVSGLQRGDVVAVRFSDSAEILHIKRIVGMPGEQVQIRDGMVFINGNQFDEPYLAPGTQTAIMDKDTWRLDAQEYFVMGDNRPESADSRWHGPITLSNIVGRVTVRVAAAIK